MNQDVPQVASNNISSGFKQSFAWVSLIFCMVIFGNLAGYVGLRKFNAEIAETKQIADLIQQRKLALTQFVSASSNSAIGLATTNWKLLLNEREAISKQITQFERMGEKIQDILVRRSKRNEDRFSEYSRKIEEEWSEIKRQNVVILRTKNSELINNEALPVFIDATKHLQETFQQHQDDFSKTVATQEERVDYIAQSISYLNICFEVGALPLLVFLVFVPGLRRARELEVLRANQVSLSKLSALGEMAGGVAHEINNPLAVIKSVSSQMNELLSEEPLEKGMLLEMTATIEKTADRIAKIVQGLRTFSRDGSRDVFHEVNVKHLIEGTVSLCRERFKSHEIDLKSETFPFDLSFEGRETEISQIILNLLNNAHDAILERKDKWVSVSVAEKSGWIEIYVTDCGGGVPVEIREKMFQPFFTTKDIGKGTGLGLSVSEGIAKNHGGELRIDSDHPNTRFVIRLPQKQTHSTRRSAA